MFSERKPPVALEAEQALIGACLLSPIGRSLAIQEVEPDDFYSDNHKEIFAAIKALDTEGPVDPVVLAQYLEARGAFERVGGHTYLLSCMNLAVHIDAPYPYIKLVRETSQRRRLERELRRGIDLLYDETLPIDDVQARIERGVLSVRPPTNEATDPEEWAATVETEAALVAAGYEGRRRIKTGLTDIDSRVRLFPKKLSILAGGTSNGKSVTAGAIAANSALRLNQRTYYWSGEMEAEELYERWAAAELGIDYEDIQLRKLTEEQVEKVKEFAKRIKASPLIVRDRAMSMMDITADCRYIAHTQGQIDLVIIDYLALLEDLNRETESQDRRDVRIGIIVWNAIQLAKELDCHVLMLHQLNREKDKRTTSRPRVSDLKDSSTIEQHAHNVFLVYRPDRDESLPEDERVQYEKMLEFIIGKQRGGMVGSVWLYFDGDKQKVALLDERRWPGRMYGPPKPGSRRKGTA